jgi:hypothetical protein
MLKAIIGYMHSSVIMQPGENEPAGYDDAPGYPAHPPSRCSPSLTPNPDGTLLELMFGYRNVVDPRTILPYLMKGYHDTSTCQSLHNVGSNPQIEPRVLNKVVYTTEKSNGPDYKFLLAH